MRQLGSSSPDPKRNEAMIEARAREDMAKVARDPTGVVGAHLAMVARRGHTRHLPLRLTSRRGLHMAAGEVRMEVEAGVAMLAEQEAPTADDASLLPPRLTWQVAASVAVAYPA